MKTKTFSIIVPVYNAEEFLRECMQSIMNSSYREWELLLVNDGNLQNLSLQ